MNDIFLYKTLLSLFGLMAGVFSMYLGYRLFDRAAASRGEFEGRVAGFSVTIRNYGPGVFFCLFGAVMIVVAMTRSYSHVATKTVGEARTETTEVVADSAVAAAEPDVPASSVDDPDTHHRNKH